jgi:asparagine synthase (glutamine-hydrolysing)
MNDLIRHRGPDDSGYIDFGSFAMAMRRLSIIDVEGGKQPISNEDGTVWVVMNGEIYNHIELREDLWTKGHRFRTKTDTEVLVHAYEQYGDLFAEKLNGMFGFALWDDNRKKLIVGRDRVGIKPLYYHLSPSLLAFSSEMKSLFALDAVSNEISLEALDEFMTLEYVLAPRTMARDVRKLEPGHLLIVAAGSVTKVRYWSPEGALKLSSMEEAVPVLRAELRDAVKRHMISDVPLGAFLSGGIDSSIIVGLMSELAGQVKTFSIGFDDKSYNELSYARMVARHFGTSHEEYTLKPDPKTFLDDFTRYLDEPIGDVSIFPTFLVSKLARQQVKVALSGDGGDELFGGYDTYLADRAGQMYGKLVPSIARRAAGWAAGLLPPTEKKKGTINKIKRFVEGERLRGDIEHYRWMSFQNDEQRSELYAERFRDEVPAGTAYRRLLDHFADARRFDDRINRQSYVDLNVYLAEDILVKVDTASMANSLEVRVPFLDYRIIELALSMPGNLKISGTNRKVVLKKAFERLLPPDILGRRKEGFSIPLKNWLRRELREPMLNVLSHDAIGAGKLFNPLVVDKMVKEHLDGDKNHAHRLWCLMVVEIWRKKYLSRESAPSVQIEAANCA